MKKYLFLLAVMAFAAVAHAEWAQKLTDLPAEQLRIVTNELANKVPAPLALEKYNLVGSNQPSATGSFQVLYQGAVKSEGCDGNDNYYVSIGIYNNEIVNVSAFTNFGCHED